MTEVILITILAIFTIASIVFQVKKCQAPLNKYDKLHLLPNYSFFAPLPYSSDYRLVYKLVDEGVEDDWHEVKMYNTFHLKRCVWNPFKYYNKGFIDTSNFLVGEFHALKEKHVIKISENYINLAKVVAGEVEQPGATVRFVVVTSKGIHELSIDRVMFASYHQPL
jgi:hypothetical protein